MGKNTNCLQIIQSFVPPELSIVELGEKDNGLAIIEQDINGDGQKEIMVIYEKEGKNCLLGLALKKGKWQILWNRQLKYSHIYYFQLAQLEKVGKWEIIIAGAIPGRRKNQLMILEFKDDEIITFFREYIPFDKMAVEDVDGEDGRDEIILWQYTLLDQYLEVYRYEKGEIFSVPNLKVYLEPPVQYEEVHKSDKKKNKEGKNWELIEVTTGYMETWEVEEDILLLSERKQNETMQGLQLIITSNNKNKQHMITLTAGTVSNYQLSPGDFLGISREQVFIKINNGTEYVESFLIGLERGEVCNYLEEICYWGDSDKLDKSIEPEGEAYIVDFKGRQEFEVCMRHPIPKKHKNKKSAYIRCFKGKEGILVPYKTLYVEEDTRI